MSAATAIRATDVTKLFATGSRLRRRAAVRALDGLDLEVSRGEVFGFLGPNGAGKTTTIRILLDLLRPTAGRIEVLGHDPRARDTELRHRIGYLPGDLTMQGRATAGELLTYLAALRGRVDRGRIDQLAERLTLDLTRPMRTLSKGNRQKVGVVQAFMHNPELLILDEPTSGLDPLLQHEFLTMVREAQECGATVFFSSHVLSEVKLAASRVAIIRAGQIVDVDDVATLQHRAGQIVELTFDAPIDIHDFVALEGVDDVTRDGTTMRCLLRGEPDALLKTASRHRVVRWSARDRELDELFLDFYRLPADAVHDKGDDDAR